MRPNYEVLLGNLTISSKQNEDLEELEVKAGMDTPADNFTAILAADSDLGGELKTHDSITVKLGYESELEPSFYGTIDRIEAGVTNLRVLGLGQTGKLLKHRLNQIYLNQTAGEIVKDLCHRCRVPTGEVHDGITLASFVVTEDLPVYEYARGLAERSGFDFYSTPEGNMTFA